MVSEKDIARCVGLWLAEGDNKTTAEITFTNNCVKLVRFFGGCIADLFQHERKSPRVYAYSKNKLAKAVSLKDTILRQYQDSRARKPYYIYRVAGVRITKRWREVVESFSNKEQYYVHILQGFFAGEGNIKYPLKHNHCRLVRIAQGQRNSFVEKMLDSVGISYKYEPGSRSYNISGFENLKLVEKIMMTELHPEKKRRFKEMMSTYKEVHYPSNYLKVQVFKALVKPKTVNELAESYDRSFARLQDVVIELKKRGDIVDYRVGSVSYWVRKDSGIIVISPIKAKVLSTLTRPLRTSEIARRINRSFKSTKNRLVELERIGLVVRADYLWKKSNLRKRVLVA